MHNLEMNKNDLSDQINSEQNSKLKTKKFSRRLLIKISLMSLPVVNSIDTSKANHDKLTRENIFEKLKFVVSNPNHTTSGGGACQGSPKGQGSPTGESSCSEETKSSINLLAPGDVSKKAGGKGKENQKKES